MYMIYMMYVPIHISVYNLFIHKNICIIYIYIFKHSSTLGNKTQRIKRKVSDTFPNLTLCFYGSD